MKVLMLGWEYPPNISGGLGVATHGLASALQNHVDLQLVLPEGCLDLNKNESLNPKLLQELDLPHGYVAYKPPKHEKEIDITPNIQQKACALRQASKVNNEQQLYGKVLMDKVEDYTLHASEIAEKTDFDIIHAHDWMTFQAGVKIKEHSGKPLVLHVHSLETDRSANADVRNPIFQIEQQAIAEADLVIPVSDYTKQVIEQHYVPAENEPNLTPIHNGTQAFEKPKPAITNEANPSKKKKTKKKKSIIKNILFVGRLTAQKGVRTFIRTAEKLLEDQQNIRFIIAGLGDQLEEMMQMVEDTNLEDYVDFRGFLDQIEVNELMQEADLLFMPSVSEPFGLAALEAAQVGLPIVISNQSGVIEVLPGVLTAEYWDSKTFARHIKVLLEYKSIRKAFGKANKKAVKKQSWQKVAKKVVQAYQKLGTQQQQ